MPQVTTVKTEASDDGSHEHVVLAGYYAVHLPPDESITIPVERLIHKAWLGERHWIDLADGSQADVTAGKCPVCGLEPYFRTSADTGDEQKLLALPRN
ncbi:MAG: hypothetical protein L0221_17895 [Chloroflexi bacterium]|nr:hypothetical protein [Chloroflexota bacterium]